MALRGDDLSLSVRENMLIDSYLSSLSPSTLFDRLTEVTTRMVYGDTCSSAIFARSEGFDVAYFAFISNCKYFISRALI